MNIHCCPDQMIFYAVDQGKPIQTNNLNKVTYSIYLKNSSQQSDKASIRFFFCFLSIIVALITFNLIIVIDIINLNYLYNP